MKSSLKKLRSLAQNKSSAKGKGSSQDNLSRQSYEIKTGPSDQVLTDMQEQYDGLLAAAKRISGCSVDFSNSIHEMASCLVETFGKTGDGDVGNSFSMLAKVQYEIAKLLTRYATHVSQTIITPTDNLLKELESFMEFRSKYDEKRDHYNQMTLQKAKGRQKKGDNLSQKLNYIREELNDDVTQLDLRFQSLKHGQERSLVTQAARHHKAQVQLFSKGISSLNAVESMIKQLSSEYDVDETLSDGEVGLQVNEDSYEAEADFSVENDGEVSYPSSPSLSQAKASERLVPERSRPWEHSSKSAPLHPLSYMGANHAPIVQEVDVEQPTGKVQPYVLPSPRDANVRHYNQVLNNASKAEELLLGELLELRRIRTGNAGAPAPNEGRGHHAGASKLDAHSQIDGKHAPAKEEPFPHRWKESRSFSRGRSPSHSYSTSFSEGFDSFTARSPSKQGFLASTPTLAYNNRAAREIDVIMPAVRVVDPLYKSGPVGHSGPRGFTPSRLSPSSSPPISHLSPPVISELHKLPAPPSPPAPPKFEPSITHSAPLGKLAVISSTPAPTSTSSSAMNSSVTKSRSIPSSIALSQHQSNIIHGDNSPVVESP